MAHDESNSVLMGSAGRSAQFKEHNDQTWGVIVHSEVRQQSKFETGELLFFDDGMPRMQVIITLQTEEHLDDDDDGLRKLYVRGQMIKAVQAAVLKTGQRGIATGGKLLVRYMSDAEPKRKGMSGAKQYFAKYEAPVQTTELVMDDVEDDAELPF